MKPLRIVLADDHAVVRQGLKALLDTQTDFEVIGEAASGQEACQKAEELRPDMVVMDVAMPGLGGAAATKRLSETCPDVKVLALSAYEDEIYVRQLMTLGAAGYVLKRSAADELAQAIRVVVAGGTYVDPLVAAKLAGAGTSSGGKNSGRRSDNGNVLSERETEVLRLIARGYTNKEIAVQLCLSVKTVETYKTRVGEKLDLHSRAEIVRYALAQGWLQDDAAVNTGL